MVRQIQVLLAALAIVPPAPAAAAWEPAGNIVCAAAGDRYHLSMVADGAGGVFCAWTDYRAAAQVYIQRVAATGEMLWPVNGIPVSPYTPSYHPVLLADEEGGVFIAWQSGGIWVQRLDAAGEFLWSVPVAVRPTGGSEGNHSLIADGAGGVVVVWKEYGLIGERGAFGQRVDAGGGLLWGEDAVRISTDDGEPSICPDDNGGVHVAWAARRDVPHLDIYAQHVASDGSLVWPVGGVLVCGVEYTQASPQVVGDGVGGAIVAWRDYGQSILGFYAQRLDSSGAPLWAENGNLILEAPLGSEHFALVADGDGGVIAALPEGHPTTDLHGQRLDAQGARLWSGIGVVICDAARDQAVPRVVLDGSGGAYVAWQDERRGGCVDIYAQKLTASGQIQWATDGVGVALLDGDKRDHRIVAAGPEDIYAFWRDSSGDDTLYILPIGASGSGVTEECTSSSNDVPELATSLILLSNHPNPFSPRTDFTFSLPGDGHVRLTIHDVAGRLVATVVDRWFAAGVEHVAWEGDDARGVRMRPGVYFARLHQGDAVRTRKITLLH